MQIISYVSFKNGEHWSNISGSKCDLMTCLCHNNVQIYVFEKGHFVIKPFPYIDYCFECSSVSALLHYLDDLGIITYLRFDFIGCDVEI